MEIISSTLATLGGAYILKKTFDRAPRRKVPASGIVSPASGKIIAIETIDPKRFVFKKKGVTNEVHLPELGSKATMIVIEMNIKDVHVQRAPIAGKIIYSKHIPGKHKNVLRNKAKKHSYIENEKNITIIDSNDDGAVCVIQVAGFVARRIKTRVKLGQKVKKGAIIGKISFGSQTILILPYTKDLNIDIGDRVTDGVTIVKK